jgi:alkylated DNA nucleotide flippase Atl1
MEEHSETAVAVLDVVDAIPPGLVMTYGDVAARVGLRSARQVGQVLARHGHEVPWHRVVMADGSVALHNAIEQLARLRAEGVPVRGGRVDLRRARVPAGGDLGRRSPTEGG